MENFKMAVISNSSSSLPLIGLLAQKKMLVGVLIPDITHQESIQFAKQLAEASITLQQYEGSDVDAPMTALSAWQCQLGIVFCCSKKIPLEVANLPTYGCVNLHAASLPEYRGALPLYWQIRHGVTEFQLTAHRLNQDFDTGNIVAQVPVAIGSYDTIQRVFDSLYQQIPLLVDKLIDQIECYGQLQENPQQGEAKHIAPLITAQDLEIDWHHISATELCDQVRAGNPVYGGALLRMGQSQVQLLQATPSSHLNYGAPPGTIIHISLQEGLIVALKDESVRLDIVANNDGILGGYRFAQICHLSAGMKFT
ncbi:methionyl-tRNA formyltransferase [Marinomonas fungiae]|uniref:methionyl-tRNA formyltransferase n=1 Tax=Marinomonas fungiae TaxID=1137284 RepID=UPI003A9534CB